MMNGYQQIYSDPTASQNAFATGYNTGSVLRGRQDAQAIGNAFSSGNYEEAANTAFGQGNVDQGLAIREFAQKASAQEKAAAAQRATQGAQLATGLLNLPPEQIPMALAPGSPIRAQAEQLVGPQGIDAFLSLPPDAQRAQLLGLSSQFGEAATVLAGNQANFTLGENDTRVDAVSGQQTIGRAGQEARGLEAYANQTGRMNAQTARQKANNPQAGGTIRLPDGTVIQTGSPEAADYTQFKFGAEGMARAATGLPGIKTANQQLDQLFEQGARFADNPRNRAATAAGFVPTGIGDFVERTLGDDSRDLLLRASSSYESVLLPILSGAAVTPSEAQRTIRAALPAPGDSDAVLRAKADHRRMTEAVIEAGVSGRPVNINALVESGRQIDEMGGQTSEPASNAPPEDSDWEVIG